MKNARLAARHLSVAAILALVATAGPAMADNGNPHPGVGEKHFVDCSAPTPGDGSDDAPFNSLAQASAASFGPGDQLLFKRGVTCVGTLRTSGSGTSGSPFTIASYGNPHKRAVLNGNGAATVIHLFNSQHVVVDGLEITNPANETPSSQRGIWVELRDFGTGTGYTIRNVYMHDVLGRDAKGTSGSQGIAFQVTGSSIPTKFHDVRILNNRLHNINRQGMNIQLSTWSCRPEISCTGTPNWLGATGVVVRGNHLSSLGGDGIVLNTTDGAIAERNTIEGFNERSAGWNAGLWTYNSNGFLGQFNDVSGGFGTKDSMAYDIDGGNLGATFQYNLSHDNDGGFFLFCPINGPVRDAVVRYNLSVNDEHRGIENCRNAVESAQVYNNTIYIGDGVSQVVVNEGQPGLRNVTFANNIVQKVGAGTVRFNHDATTGYVFENNILAGAIDNQPLVHPGGSTADPMLCNPVPATTFTETLGFRLRSGSPAIGAGLPVAGNGGRDFFGNTLASPPSIGASEGAGC
ncbi:hypothetical protein ACFXJ8_38670 [Nonomuraea sp. NPDC059194]|uniref:hypothetical protein n=1 Tax=Nonomuraea sp. NPDC059194 TaxID=3346764 RepID=UPI0036B35F0B